MYSEKDVEVACLDYFNGDDLAANVVRTKYLLRDRSDNLVEKSPSDKHWRLAREFSRIDCSKFKLSLAPEQVFSYLDKYKYIVPQGSPMTAIGDPYRVMSISNCFVLEPPLDSYGGIHRTDEQLSQVSKRRGGTGIDISFIRPAGTITSNSSKTSTGIIPFMERYSNSIREVGQGGRRGALMMTISVHHPQVLDFARVKLDRSKITGANISIRLSNEFLNAVKNNTEYEQRWPVTGTPIISKKVNAREVWYEIIKCAHEMAEPGLLFWDNIIAESLADCYKEFGFETVCTNPCSELPLSVLDSCRLLLLNLYSYVVDPFTKNARFDYALFYEHCQVAQRLMDNLVDIEIEHINKIIDKVKSDPEPDDIKKVELDLWTKVLTNCKRGRRTGCGITALGDTIAALGLKYGGKASIELTDKIYKTLKFGCYMSSVDMAKEIGPFEVWNWEKEKDCPFLKRFEGESLDLGNGLIVHGKDILDKMKQYGRRNIALLTSAPAGSVSCLTQTTSGIEPIFMMAYKRRKKINHNDKESRVDFVDPSGDQWQEFTVYHPKVQEWMNITGETDLSKSPWSGCCADDLDWKQRVKLQAAAQRHVDHAISSTINLPEDVTVERVAEIYEEAWKQGLKGITVYRKNCRTGVLVENKNTLPKHNAPDRPKELPCDVHHVSVKGKKYFVLVGLFGDDKEPYEVFAGRGNLIKNSVTTGKIIKVRSNFYKAILEDGSELSPITLGCNEEEESITRLVSMTLRHGANLEFVIDQISKIESDLTSFIKSIARALKKYVQDGTKSGDQCECGNELIFENGCVICKSCGATKCQ